MARDLNHRAAFESHGETYTRMLSEQGGEVGAEAKAWLAEQQLLRDEASSAKRDAREEMTLSIAREANAIASDALSSSREANKFARNANRWAASATVIAIITAIIAYCAIKA